MFYIFGGNASGIENTGSMSVFDTAHIANTCIVRGFALWILSIPTSSMLWFNPARKSTAGNRSNSGGHRRYCQYSGVLCCGYYQVFMPLPSYYEYFTQYSTKLSQKYAQVYSRRTVLSIYSEVGGRHHRYKRCTLSDGKWNNNISRTTVHPVTDRNCRCVMQVFKLFFQDSYSFPAER